MCRLSCWILLFIGLTLLPPCSFDQEHTFPASIDAISFGVPGKHLELAVSGWDGDAWSAWEQLGFEREDDPFSSESTLVLFARPVTKIRMRGDTKEYEPHPIIVSREPVRFTVAALGIVGTPRILLRDAWGADAELLYRDEQPRQETGEMTQARSDQVPKRVLDCQTLQRDHPSEFTVSKTVTTDANGRTYLWPRQYSKDVNLFVVHHTALKVTGDQRSPVERLRAIYQYHAKNLGWGDIGYHYLIDENGQVYEGRAGGEKVIGGHAYCYNVGTVGVSLMGNFDEEQPTQPQMQSLQWLLSTLAEQYGIDPSKNVQFHGNTLPPIVGHGDLMATACPGYYVRETLGQVRSHVSSGDLTTAVRFPVSKTFVNKTEERRQRRMQESTSKVTDNSGLLAWGSTTIRGRPGSQLLFSMRYKAGNTLAQKQLILGSILRSDPSIRLWVRDGDAFTEVEKALMLPRPVVPEDVILLQMKIGIPVTAGTYTVDIGGIRYTIQGSGRRVRVRE